MEKMVMVHHRGKAWKIYFHVIEKADYFGKTRLVMTTEVINYSFTDKDQPVYGCYDLIKY
jgi:hypothetical protein